MYDAKKVRLLNKLLAESAPYSFAMCADAAAGIEKALASEGVDAAGLEIFAKRILALYNPSAAVEVVEVEPASPLFAVAPLSQAAHRLAGYPKAYLVVCGLDAPKRRTKKAMDGHFADVDFVEDYIARYSQALPNLEIIFL